MCVCVHQMCEEEEEEKEGEACTSRPICRYKWKSSLPA